MVLQKIASWAVECRLNLPCRRLPLRLRPLLSQHHLLRRPAHRLHRHTAHRRTTHRRTTQGSRGHRWRPYRSRPISPRPISLRGPPPCWHLLSRRSSWSTQRESMYSQGWCLGWWRSARRAWAAACCASVGQEEQMQRRLESRGSVLRQRKAAASGARKQSTARCAAQKLARMTSNWKTRPGSSLGEPKRKRLRAGRLGVTTCTPSRVPSRTTGILSLRDIVLFLTPFAYQTCSPREALVVSSEFTH